MAFTTARLDAAIDSAVVDTSHIQLHDGDPGAAGTNNVLAEAARTAFVFPAAGGDGETEQTATITITGATAAITHATGWDAASGGVFQWSAVLAPQETFAGAGELDVTITATASAV